MTRVYHPPSSAVAGASVPHGTVPARRRPRPTRLRNTSAKRDGQLFASQAR